METTQAKANDRNERPILPLLTPNEQKVLAAVASLVKKAPGMVDLPKPAEIAAEIAKLGHEPPASLVTISVNLRRLEEKGYIVREPIKVVA